MTCPTQEELLEALSQATPCAARSHLESGCGSCTKRAARLTQMLSGLEQGALPPVPGSLHAAILSIGGRAEPPPPSRLRLLVASLVRDLLSPAPVPAMRGSDVSGPRMLFRADPYDIDLALTADETLIGQVIPDDQHADEALEDAFCVLHDDRTRVAQLEASGEFQFESVEAGTYQLQIEWGHTRILLPEVTLPGTPA